MVPHLPPSRAPLVRITANNVSLVVTDELAAPHIYNIYNYIAEHSPPPTYDWLLLWLSCGKTSLVINKRFHCSTSKQATVLAVISTLVALFS